MEGFEPRPNASKQVAAAKRAQRQHDATQPNPAPALPSRQHLPFGIGAFVIILLMIGMASYQLSRAPQPLAITPGPSTTAFFTAPTATPAPTVQPTIAPDTHVVDAYAAPDGALLGPVDLAGELVIAVGRAGSAWVQLERGDHSRLWFKRADLPANLAVPQSLPDLSPRAAPAPQSGQGMTFNQADNGWTPPAQPTAAASTGQKEASDRAAPHATAVARDHQTTEKGSK
jgi:hypothetical protein